MKKVGVYVLPDNAKLAGVGFGGCYYYSSVGDIYRVRIVNGVQHFRCIQDIELSELIHRVMLHAI